jgi:hypothetical protein
MQFVFSREAALMQSLNSEGHSMFKLSVFLVHEFEQWYHKIKKQILENLGKVKYNE